VLCYTVAAVLLVGDTFDATFTVKTANDTETCHDVTSHTVIMHHVM